MAATHTYNADQVIFTFAGIAASEMGEDQFVEIERMTAAFTSKASVDGSVVREQTNDDRAKVSVHLLATSKVNGLWSAVHAADKASKNGKGVAPLSVSDKNAKAELHFAEQAWIAEEPKVTFARGVGERVWVFECASLKSVHSGY